MKQASGISSILPGALVPWVAVLVFWTVLHSAWATILAYHVMMLAFSRRELARAFRGWNRRVFLVSAAPCLLAGPVTWLLLPSITLTPVGGWLAAFGLTGASLLVMIPYYGLIHPFVEQAHWSRLRSDPRLGLVSSLLFAGYHGLVLSTLMKPFWVGLCVAVLIVTSISWRRIEERCGGGLLVPALTQVLADAGMIVAAVLRAN
jgi:hypothetical protein